MSSNRQDAETTILYNCSCVRLCVALPPAQGIGKYRGQYSLGVVYGKTIPLAVLQPDWFEKRRTATIYDSKDIQVTGASGTIDDCDQASRRIFYTSFT